MMLHGYKIMHYMYKSYEQKVKGQRSGHLHTATYRVTRI